MTRGSMWTSWVSQKQSCWAGWCQTSSQLNMLVLLCLFPGHWDADLMILPPASSDYAEDSLFPFYTNLSMTADIYRKGSLPRIVRTSFSTLQLSPPALVLTPSVTQGSTILSFPGKHSSHKRIATKLVHILFFSYSSSWLWFPEVSGPSAICLLSS